MLMLLDRRGAAAQGGLTLTVKNPGTLAFTIPAGGTLVLVPKT